MNASIDIQRLQDAVSFLPPEVRAALSASPDGSTCRTLPDREVVVLWCDISGFSGYTNQILASGPEGVEDLHKALSAHYDHLLNAILERGGEPIAFVGDGLMSIWEGSDAAMSAVATAAHLSAERKAGKAEFDLNLHISSGEYRTVELGGRHDRWLLATLGSALKSLEEIAGLRDTNAVFMTDAVAAACAGMITTNDAGQDGARKLDTIVRPPQAQSVDLAVPQSAAWESVLSRTPRPVSRWIESIGLQWAAELRPVTSVMVSLQGFDQGADNAAERLNEIVRAAQDIVHGRDGYVDSAVIDDKGASLLFFFGAPPDAHSDDPTRSILAAIEVQHALDDMGVGCSIGVATGRAFCAILGNEQRRSYLVLGDVVTRSSRLATAIDDGVLADEQTMRATQAAVGYETSALNLSLKGLGDQVQAWRTTSDDAIQRDTHTMAGRDTEISTLSTIWAETVAGNQSGVVIEGESGTGKTFLASNLRTVVEDQGGIFAAAAASLISQASPFGGVRRILMQALNITPTMGLIERQITVLETLPADLQDSAPLLNAVFATGLAETALTADLAGQARAKAIQDLLVQLYKTACAGRKVCLCIDDAQWLDDASKQLVLRWSREIPGLMLVIITQPIEDENWRMDLQLNSFHQMDLGRLDRKGLATLVTARLGCGAVDAPVIDQIEATTDGQPFFSSEMIQSLSDQGGIYIDNGTAKLASGSEIAAIEIPDTVRGMVLQRLDRLDPSEQLSLRVASVAGARFPTRMVCDVHPLDIEAAAVRQQLHGHADIGFLEHAAMSGQPGFGFSHMIVRDVAYGQLPAQPRRDLHEKVGEWIEGSSGADRGSRLLELAHHWSESANIEKAVNCLLEESLRVFSQGYAIESVQVGLRAVRLTGVDVPDGPEALQAAIGANMAAIGQQVGDRHPTELLAEMAPPPPEAVLKLTAVLSTAPFAFQSNQFEVFAWAASEGMRLTLEAGGGPPHAFSMYSIIVSALTGDRANGAAWSRAALDLDGATGGGAIGAVGFIDSWFHGHWRAPLSESIEINKAGAKQALADGDFQYASYNISGEIVLRAALGQPLQTIIDEGYASLEQHLHRNSRMQAVMEIQYARALRGETGNILSMTTSEFTEEDDIAWVTQTEFVNQIGYYLATRARLHRHAGDWAGALACAEQVAPAMPAIAGQTAEFDLVLPVVLARIAMVLEEPSTLDGQRDAIAENIASLASWRTIHPGNFAAKAGIAEAAWDGVTGDRNAAADRLAEIAAGLGPDENLQDRALALEYAARLAPGTHKDAAIAAYHDWGATAMAARMAEVLG